MIVEAALSSMVSIVEMEASEKRKRGRESEEGEDKMNMKEKVARRKLSMTTWAGIEAAAVATVIGPHYSSAQKLMDNVRRLSVAKVASNIIHNQASR